MDRIIHTLLTNPWALLIEQLTIGLAVLTVVHI